MKLLPIYLFASLPILAAEEILAPKAIEGAKRALVLERKTSVTTDSATLSFGPDQEQDVGAGMTRTGTFKALIKETVVGAADGRERKLRRDYTEIGTETSTEGTPEEVHHAGGGSQTSALEGKSVDFTFDEKDEEWSADWSEDHRGENGWLEGLETFVDLRFVLPTESIEEGARWELDPESLDRLLWPAGRLMVTEPAEEADLPEGGIAIRIPDIGSIRSFEDATGDIDCKLEALKMRDGRRIAVISIAAEVELSTDVGDLFAIEAERAGQPEQEYDAAALERSLEGEGELLWDIEAGVLVAYTFEAEMTTEVDLAWTLEAGITLEITYHTEQSSTTEVSLKPAE